MFADAINAQLKLALPADKLESVLYHPSFPGLSPEIRSTNKDYAVLGSAIIEASYALFLLHNNLIDNRSDYGRAVDSIFRRVTNSLYYDYSLEQYVYCSQGEQGKAHKEIVAKIIALDYYEHGFSHVYNFLLPTFLKKDVLSGKDSKTIVFEYAQSKKLPVVYDSVYSSGPEHNKLYDCTLRVGSSSVSAQGIGKKGAERAAADLFVRKFSLSETSRTDQMKKKQDKKTFVSFRRFSKLEEFLSKIDLPNNCIDYSLLNQALTHISYSKRQNGLSPSNELLTICGSYILFMLSAEYVIENYNRDTISVVAGRSALLDEKNLCKVLPDSCLDYALLFNTLSDRKAQDRFKIDILKSVLAGIWINYLDTSDLRLYSIARSYAFRCLSISEKDRVLHYYSALLMVAQKRNYRVSSQTTQLREGKAAIFQTSLSIQGENWQLSEIGYDRTVKASRDYAAKELLLPILDRNQDDVVIRDIILRYVDPEVRCEYEFSHQKNTSVSSYSATNQDEHHEPIATINLKKKAVYQTHKPDYEEVDFCSPSEVLWVRRNDDQCKNQGHQCNIIHGYVQDIDGNDVQLDAVFCKQCCRYYIDLRKLRYYRTVHGFLIGNFRMLSGGSYEFEKLADESLLKNCGYTVNQAEGLSAKQRQAILKRLLEQNLLTKQRIISYLKFFIKNGQGRRSMRYAVSSWTADLKWVQSYEVK